MAEGDYIDSFDTSAHNADPIGITTDGTNIWTLDYASKNVEKRAMNGDYISEWSISPQTFCYSITTDGTNIYILEASASPEIYKYTMAGTYVSKVNFTSGIYGIEIIGSYFYATDLPNTRVSKFDLDGTYVSSWSTNVDNTGFRDLTSDGTHIWVMDYTDLEVYKYEIDGTYVSSWSLTGANTNVWGIATNGINIWAIDRTDDEVYKYEGPAVGTNMQINISDTFKDVDSIQINIGDAWKDVIEVQQNIGDVWKTVY